MLSYFLYHLRIDGSGRGYWSKTHPDLLTNFTNDPRPVDPLSVLLCVTVVKTTTACQSLTKAVAQHTCVSCARRKRMTYKKIRERNTVTRTEAPGDWKPPMLPNPLLVQVSIALISQQNKIPLILSIWGPLAHVHSDVLRAASVCSSYAMRPKSFGCDLPVATSHYSRYYSMPTLRAVAYRARLSSDGLVGLRLIFTTKI